MLPAAQWKSHFDRALAYGAYLDAHASASQRSGWDGFHAKVALTPPQTALIAGFNRRINVLVLSGTWCGDCVQQVPILERIAAANPARAGTTGGIDLHFLERDPNPELAKLLSICGGQRVPVAVFLNEDFDFVALAGDRPLARYRALAARQFGASCPLPGAPVPSDELAATVQGWLDEFERVALLLRLSTKLRQRHGD
jgi:thiol-disulfide isomerase/thioredoxin